MLVNMSNDRQLQLQDRLVQACVRIRLVAVVGNVLALVVEVVVCHNYSCLMSITLVCCSKSNSRIEVTTSKPIKQVSLNCHIVAMSTDSVGKRQAGLGIRYALVDRVELPISLQFSQSQRQAALRTKSARGNVPMIRDHDVMYCLVQRGLTVLD